MTEVDRGRGGLNGLLFALAMASSLALSCSVTVSSSLPACVSSTVLRSSSDRLANRVGEVQRLETRGTGRGGDEGTVLTIRKT